MFGIFKKKPSYNRDYIIGSICSMVESQMGGSDLDSFMSGKLVISNEVRSLGWIGGSSVPSDGYSLLLDLNQISSDEKMLINLMLEGVGKTHGMAKTVATDMVANALPKCLKQGSEQYAKLDFDDPRLH